jgi:hypothetical protein
MSKILITSLALLGVGSAQAQLLIDRAGGRDVLYRGDFTAANKVRAKFNSGDKSLSATYFGYALTNLFPEGNFVVGGRAKVAATDGWEEFFRFQRLPGMEASLLANWTSTGTNGPIWFANGRVSYKHEEYALFDPTQGVATQFSRPSFDGVSAAISAGGLRAITSMNLEVGLALSAGYERGSNYKDLGKANVTDISASFPLPGGGRRDVSGAVKSVRVGTLKEFNSFPLNVTFTFDKGLPRSLYDWIPFIPKDDQFGLVLAPYGEFLPKDEGKPEHAIGVQLTLRRNKNETSYDQILANGKSTYPISVFIERRNAFKSNSETRAGVGLVYSF